MGIRRKAREHALQALYYMDVRRDCSPEALALYRQCFPPSKQVEPFFNRLVEGTLRHCNRLDTLIERFSSNWKISRMSCVDRNIMRMAVFELLFCDDIPVKVSINEAVDIGKKFGTEESGAFINGVIDRIRIAMEQGDAQIVAQEQTE
jgi:N utilization substance protein B